MFQRYQSDLSKMPSDWKKVNDASGKVNEAFAATAGVLVDSLLESRNHAKALVDNLRAATDAQKQFGSAARAGDKSLHNMATNARHVADSVFKIGKFVLKTAAWGTGLFAGGLFGIDKLAQGAVGSQRSARGLGLTTGQYRSFGVNMGRISSESTLSNVAKAQNDYLGQVMLAKATGLTPQQVMSMDAGTLAGKLTQSEHDAWHSTPAAQRATLAMLPQYKYLGQTTEDFRRSGAASSAEIASARAHYASDASKMNVGDRDTNALFGFVRQLKTAGTAIETTLSKKMAQLSPSLTKFIASLEKDADILINKVFTPHNLDAIGKGMTTFANYLGSASFQNSVKSFVDGLASMAHFMAKLFPDPKTNVKNGSLNYNYWDNPAHADPKSTLWHPGNYVSTRKKGFLTQSHYMGPYFNEINPNTSAGKNHIAWMYAQEKKYGLPSGMLVGQAYAESSGNKNAISPAGAKGIMQLMDPTAKQYGVSNPFDFKQSVSAAAMYDRDLMKRYHGDLGKALAGYNAGQGNVDKASAYGSNWQSHLPKPSETVPYISKVKNFMDNIAKGQPIKINITNTSGTNVAVSSNAAAM